MRRHFQDVHPIDLVVVPKEGCYFKFERCGMQVNPLYPNHRRTKECQVRVECRQQQEMTVLSALALCQQFTVHGDVLECVEVFKYLGRLLAQDDDDIQAIRAQLRKSPRYLGLRGSSSLEQERLAVRSRAVLPGYPPSHPPLRQ